MLEGYPGTSAVDSMWVCSSHSTGGTAGADAGRVLGALLGLSLEALLRVELEGLYRLVRRRTSEPMLGPVLSAAWGAALGGGRHSGHSRH
jgi:hypothetical protein